MERADYHVNVVWKAFPVSNNYYGLNPAKMAIVDSKTAGEVNLLIPPERQAQWRNLSLRQVDGHDVYAHVSARLMNELDPPPNTTLALPDNLPAYIQWRWTPPIHTIMFSVLLADSNGTNERPWDFHVSHRSDVYAMRMGLSYECVVDEA